MNGLVPPAEQFSVRVGGRAVLPSAVAHAQAAPPRLSPSASTVKVHRR